jgi:histidinol-phosphate aminotransferase
MMFVGDNSLVRLHLSENERPSPLARAAAAEEAARLGRYPDPTYANLTAELATFWQVRSDEVVVSNGSDELLLLSALAFGAQAAGVVTAGTFLGHRYAVEATGRQATEVPLAPDGRIDAIGFSRALDRAGVAFVCNPHNPGGSALADDDLAAIVEAAQAAGSTLVVDEAYMEYADHGTASLAGPPRDGVIVLRTFSKAYGLAGLRVGYAIGSAGDLDAIRHLQRVVPFRVNRVGVAAAIAALRDPEHLARIRGENSRKRAWLTSALHAKGIEARPSVTNFVAIPVANPDAIRAHLLEKHRIVVRDTSDMGYAGHIRVSLGEESALQCVVDTVARFSESACPT